MNVLQNFVWGNKLLNSKNIKPIENNIDFYFHTDETRFCEYSGSTKSYIKGNSFSNYEQNKYKKIKVNIRQHQITGEADAVIYDENSIIYVFIECQNDSGDFELYKFYIGKKLGEFYLELPTAKKIDKIYSVVGPIILSIATPSYDIPGFGCAVYSTDALVSYELIQ